MWRKPGTIQNGAACATCHSPDGIELAEYAFDDDDIRRRAMPHLGPEGSQRIVEYIHDLRKKLGITKLRDPNLDRPLQPGGEILPGKTPADRDLAFGRELQSKLPALFGSPIRDEDQAAIAEHQILALSPTTLKIGIPLSRLSEDVVHGSEHASISQWLPEEPPIIAKDQLDNWYDQESIYLQNPTALNLQTLLKLHAKLVNVNLLPGLAAISAVKFRSLLVLQDRMRRGVESANLVVTDEMKPLGSYNVFWELGEFARDMLRYNPRGLQMSTETQSKKLGEIPLGDQLKQIRVTWFWLGWLSDQGLFKTSHDVSARYGLWLSQSLNEDGPYPIHSIYSNARRQAVISNDLEAWAEPIERRRRIWDMGGARAFHSYDTFLPSESTGEYRRLYVIFTANCFRMSLQLFKRSIEQTGIVWVKISSRAIVKEMTDWLGRVQPDQTVEDEKLKEQLLILINRAGERQM